MDSKIPEGERERKGGGWVCLLGIWLFTLSPATPVVLSLLWKQSSSKKGEDSMGTFTLEHLPSSSEKCWSLEEGLQHLCDCNHGPAQASFPGKVFLKHFQTEVFKIDLASPKKPKLFRSMIVRRSHSLDRNQSGGGKYLNLVVCWILHQKCLLKVLTQNPIFALRGGG